MVKLKLTCKWLLISSLVSPSTFIRSLICFGVAAAINGTAPSLDAQHVKSNRDDDVVVGLTVGAAELLKGVQESAVEIWRPAASRLPMGLKLPFLLLLLLFSSAATTIAITASPPLSSTTSTVSGARSHRPGSRRWHDELFPLERLECAADPLRAHCDRLLRWLLQSINKSKRISVKCTKITRNYSKSIT